MKQENPWRVSAPVLHNGKYDSVIIDRGEWKKALPSSTNLRHVFEDTTSGARSLIIVGTPLQIFEFLLSHQKHGVESRIKSLPDIYVGVAKFQPMARFEGIFPIGDTLVSVVKYFAGTVNVPSWAALPIAAKDLKDVFGSIEKLSDQQKQHGEVLYMKFSYFKETGMEKIATQNISFLQLAEEIVRRYKKP